MVKVTYEVTLFQSRCVVDGKEEMNIGGTIDIFIERRTFAATFVARIVTQYSPCTKQGELRKKKRDTLKCVLGNKAPKTVAKKTMHVIWWCLKAKAEQVFVQNSDIYWKPPLC